MEVLAIVIGSLLVVEGPSYLPEGLEYCVTQRELLAVIPFINYVFQTLP